MTTTKFNDEALIKMLTHKIPEFEKEISPELRFSAYIIFGHFGIFMNEKILDKTPELDLIKRAFDFLNELIENGDEKIIQMLRVTTLENLIDHNQTIDTAKKYFTKKGLGIFLEVLISITGRLS